MRSVIVIGKVELIHWQAMSVLDAISSSIKSVYMVESSPSLREKQKTLLCGDAPMEETDIGFKSRSKYADIQINWCEDLDLIPKGRSNL